MNVVETILRRACGGDRPREIARDLDISPCTVHRALCDARKSGIDVPRFRPGRKPRAVKIPATAMRDLEPAARARGITLGELAIRLVSAIAEDGLADNVLDDGIVTKG